MDPTRWGWHFDMKKLENGDPEEIAMVRRGMTIQHETLSSFPMIWKHIAVPGHTSPSKEMVFAFFTSNLEVELPYIGGPSSAVVAAGPPPSRSVPPPPPPPPPPSPPRSHSPARDDRRGKKKDTRDMLEKRRLKEDRERREQREREDRRREERERPERRQSGREREGRKRGRSKERGRDRERSRSRERGRDRERSRSRERDDRPQVRINPHTRMPVREDLSMVQSRIHEVCEKMFFSRWIFWDEIKKDTKLFFKFHSEVRKAWRGGNGINDSFINTKASRCLRDRRYQQKKAVKAHYDKSGEYEKPSTMKQAIFDAIVKELTAAPDTPVHRRAHQGDVGAASQERPEITNYWGRAGFIAFKNKFVSILTLPLLF